MVHLQENSILITLPADEPAQRLADLQTGLIYVLNDFFSHLGNEVDVEAGAAYNDLLRILQATMPSPEQLARIGTDLGKDSGPDSREGPGKVQ